MNHPRNPVNAAITTIALICSPLAYAADAVQPAAAASMPMAAAPAPAAAVTMTSGTSETGLAAVYSDRLQGRKTASGERYDRARLTAAHKTLAFGTQVKVTNQKNQKSVAVRITDRGPTQAGRVLDLSPAAAKVIGIGPKSMAEVTLTVVGEPPKKGTK